jgi:hypothetical protein
MLAAATVTVRLSCVLNFFFCFFPCFRFFWTCYTSLGFFLFVRVRLPDLPFSSHLVLSLRAAQTAWLMAAAYHPEVSAVVGSGSEGYAEGVGGEATFAGPHGIAYQYDSKTNTARLYVADQKNKRIRVIDLASSTVLSILRTLSLHVVLPTSSIQSFFAEATKCIAGPSPVNDSPLAAVCVDPSDIESAIFTDTCSVRRVKNGREHTLSFYFVLVA